MMILGEKAGMAFFRFAKRKQMSPRSPDPILKGARHLLSPGFLTETSAPEIFGPKGASVFFFLKSCLYRWNKVEMVGLTYKHFILETVFFGSRVCDIMFNKI